jgi:hypothetical protein
MQLIADCLRSIGTDVSKEDHPNYSRGRNNSKVKLWSLVPLSLPFHFKLFTLLTRITTLLSLIANQTPSLIMANQAISCSGIISYQVLSILTTLL